jgi:hypothetical protein
MEYEYAMAAYHESLRSNNGRWRKGKARAPAATFEEFLTGILIDSLRANYRFNFKKRLN